MDRRRWISIPTYVACWILMIATSPLWLAATAISDAVTKNRGALLRGAVMLLAYLSYELVGLAASLCAWLWKHSVGMSEERWSELHFQLEAWWGSSLLSATCRIYGIQLEVDEGEAQLDRGPYLVFIRHTSTADTLLSSHLVCRRYGIRLRFVLKQELLWDPCLNVVGQRIPNAFVDRNSKQSAREVDRIREIATGIGAKDGVLIYPEGTRSSPERRARIIEGFRSSGRQDMLAYSQNLSSLLPPRLGGPLALLEAAPNADVVFCAHTGLEGAASLDDIRKGELIGRRVKVHFWRVSRNEIPMHREAQAQWILDRWREVDEWIANNEEGKAK